MQTSVGERAEDPGAGSGPPRRAEPLSTATDGRCPGGNEPRVPRQDGHTCGHLLQSRLKTPAPNLNPSAEPEPLSPPAAVRRGPDLPPPARPGPPPAARRP